MISFTILTPTYNRANLIPRIYESLKNQTYKNFEWIIVDDGSTDNTKELINQYINENILNINYIYKNNGGKHTAVNEGVRQAKGNMLLVLDSDDELINNSLETFTEYIDNLNEDIVSISGLDVYRSNGDIVPDKFPKDEFISDHIQCKMILNIKGDKAEVYKTEILRKFPFPEIEGEKFITEDIVYNAIAMEGYKTIYINKPIKIIEYLEDGLTSQSYRMSIKNPKGKMLIFNQYINMDILGITKRIRAGISYSRFGFLSRKKIKAQFRECNNKYIYLLGVLPGYILYIRDKLKSKQLFNV